VECVWLRLIRIIVNVNYLKLKEGVKGMLSVIKKQVKRFQEVEKTHYDKNIELKYYNQKEVWEKYNNNIAEVERAKRTINLIPHDVMSVLDIGCGNGIITNMIKKPFVVGLDFAKVPLAQVRTHVILASCDKLPIKSEKFDLIVLTEVLEHLDDETYVATIEEIRRLKPKYLLITVPFEENIELHLCKCSVCGNLFHMSHHYRKFDDSWFYKDFPEFDLVKIEYTTYYTPRSEKLILLKQKFGVYSYSDVAVCNKCGGHSQRPNLILRYILDGLILIDIITKKIFKIKRPYHQIVLLKRKAESTSENRHNVS